MYLDLVTMEPYLDKKGFIKILKVSKSNKNLIELFKKKQKMTGRKSYTFVPQASNVGILLADLIKHEKELYTKFLLFFRDIAQQVCDSIFNNSKFWLFSHCLYYLHNFLLLITNNNLSSLILPYNLDTINFN